MQFFLAFDIIKLMKIVKIQFNGIALICFSRRFSKYDCSVTLTSYMY